MNKLSLHVNGNNKTIYFVVKRRDGTYNIWLDYGYYGMPMIDELYRRLTLNINNNDIYKNIFRRLKGIRNEN